MFKWLHHALNPHCPDCLADKLRREEVFRQEQEKDSICKSCEVLTYEVERLRADNDKLLQRVLTVPDPIQDRLVAPEPVAPLPRQNSWAVRRQMLEQESRERARLLATAPKPTDTVDDLEKELGVAESARQAEGNSTKS